MTNYGLSTFFIELCDSVVLNVFFARKAQFLFNRQFHGEPVTVPAGLADNVVTLHGAIAGKNIFEGPSFNVVGPWSSICRGWSFIESPGWATCACLHRSGEGSLRFPKIKDFVLQIAKIHRGWDHFVHVYALFSE